MYKKLEPTKKCLELGQSLMPILSNWRTFMIMLRAGKYTIYNLFFLEEEKEDEKYTILDIAKDVSW